MSHHHVTIAMTVLKLYVHEIKTLRPGSEFNIFPAIGTSFSFDKISPRFEPQLLQKHLL